MTIPAGSMQLLEGLLVHSGLGEVWLLGHQQHGTDFQATRDCSVDGACLFTYKLCRYPPFHLDRYARGILPRYFPQVFGEVRAVNIMVHLQFLFVFYLH
jgi:hypothetical protein